MTIQRLSAALSTANVRLGRRGQVLLAYALVWLTWGFKALLDPTIDDGHFLLITLLPPEARFILWSFPAVVALVVVGRKLRTTHIEDDGLGFAVLYVPNALYALSYTISFIGFLFGVTDYSGAWTDAVRNWLIIFVVLKIAGWPEVPRHPNSAVLDIRDQTVFVVHENKGGGDGQGSTD